MNIVNYKIVERDSEFWVYREDKETGDPYGYEWHEPFASLKEANNWILMVDSPEGSYMMS